MLDIDPDREPVAPKDAATVILLRDTPEGAFEVFMVRRHTRSGFMGGAYVFPGGKVDEADASERVRARCRGRSAGEAAALLGEPEDPVRAVGLYVAALRETFEEAGVLLAEGLPGDADLLRMRGQLEGGALFAALLEALDGHLRLDRMHPWARWVTPAVEHRRYDARFFVAVAPVEQEAAHDRRETTEAAWMTPGHALERGARGEIQLPPPTLRTLEELASHGTVDAVIATAAGRAPPYVDPVFVDRGGTFVLALPGDPAHPTALPAVRGPTYFVLAGGRWWSGEPTPGG